MEIKFSKETRVAFRELRGGDVFQYDSHPLLLYMKFSATCDSKNAAHLKDGMLVLVGASDLVTRVKCVLNVED